MQFLEIRECSVRGPEEVPWPIPNRSSFSLFILTVGCGILLNVQVFCDNIKTLARRGAKKVVPEGLYDALIAVVDLLQKLVSVVGNLYRLWYP